MIFLPALLFLLILTTSCVTPRIVRPLEKGQKAFRVDAGYVLEDSITPHEKNKFFLALTYAKGIDDKTTGYFTLRANYFPYPILEAGLVHAFIKSKNGLPGFSSSFTFSGLPILGQKPGLFPMFQAAPNLYWETERDKHLIYLGTTLWLWPDPDKLIQYTPQIGSTFVVNKYEYNFEFKYIPKDTEYYLTRLLNQSYGLYIGITRKF